MADAVKFLPDWQSPQNQLFLNPRLPQEILSHLQSYDFDQIVSGHIFIASSGTTQVASGQLKLVALGKAAVLHSAAAVNAWIGAQPSDVWLNPLPIFHIGGMAIYARAFLLGQQVFDFHESWSPEKFHQVAVQTGATLTSLVPTQLYDLVHANLPSPPELRGVFIGGAALEKELYDRARELDWPILPTFGCSEAASQIATAPLNSLAASQFPAMKILPHLNCKTDLNGRLSLSGTSLFSGYLFFDQGEWTWKATKKDDWFTTEDRVRIDDEGSLAFVGRRNDLIKVNGEQVDLIRLRQLLFSSALEILPVVDSRSGARLVLVGEFDEIRLQMICEEFNQKVAPYERIIEVRSVNRLPKSSLGKILRAELAEQLGFELSS